MSWQKKTVADLIEELNDCMDADMPILIKSKRMAYYIESVEVKDKVVFIVEGEQEGYASAHSE